MNNPDVVNALVAMYFYGIACAVGGFVTGLIWKTYR